MLFYYKWLQSSYHSGIRTSDGVELSETAILIGNYAVYVGSYLLTFWDFYRKRNKIYLSGKSREDFQELSTFNYGVLAC